MVGGGGRGVWRAGSCGGMEGGLVFAIRLWRGDYNKLAVNEEGIIRLLQSLIGRGENRVNFIVTTNPPPPLTPPLGDK